MLVPAKKNTTFGRPMDALARPVRGLPLDSGWKLCQSRALVTCTEGSKQEQIVDVGSCGKSHFDSFKGSEAGKTVGIIKEDGAKTAVTRLDCRNSSRDYTGKVIP